MRTMRTMRTLRRAEPPPGVTVPESANSTIDLARLRRLQLEDVPQALGDLEQARAQLWARLCAPRSRDTEKESENGNDGRLLLTAKELAERLGMSTRWVYRNRKKLGGKKLGANVRFTESGLKRYLGGLR